MDSIILLCGAVLAVRNDNPVSDIGVRYEETSFPLNEFPVEYVNDISYYAITELLEAGEPQKITVFNYSTNKIQASISVIKFYNIEITYDKAVYYDCDSSGTVTVSVRDNGIGMDEDVQKHIFEKFYQGDTSHSAKGNGLGLALVKRIIDIHSGEIQVRSAPERGTEFIVTLPRKPV